MKNKTGKHCIPHARRYNQAGGQLVTAIESR